MIYFAQTPTGSIKIGFSSRADVRIRSLENHYGECLCLLRIMPGGRGTERKIHDRFSHLRFGRTEQFRPGPDLIEFIIRPILLRTDPAKVDAIRERLMLIAIQLPAPTAEKFRVEAAKEGRSMSNMARRVIEDWIAKRGNG